MKYLKLFEDHSDIESICIELGIKNFEIIDGIVNVDDYVDLSYKGLSKFPVKFGRVSVYFRCDFNNLTSLEGCPKTVDMNFFCDNNQLTSLKGSPERVIGGYYCDSNQLKDFSGIPLGSLNEGNNFNCYNNPVHEIYSLFRTPRCIDPLNEYSAIQGNRIIWDRLEEVYYESGLDDKVPDPESLRFKNYELII